MKVKISSKRLPTGKQETRIYEGDRNFFPGVELKNVRLASIELGSTVETEISLRVDLVDMDIEGEAVVYVVSKEGSLKQIKSIKFIDGTEDVYV